MGDDIHFRNEERKKKQDWFGGAVGEEGGESGGKKKMLRLAPIKAGGGGRRVFSLTPGSGGDRRVCAPVRVVAGLIRQHFPGTREDVGEGPCGS